MVKDDGAVGAAAEKAGGDLQEYVVTDEMKEASLRAAWGMEESAGAEGNGTMKGEALEIKQNKKYLGVGNIFGFPLMSRT